MARPTVSLPPFVYVGGIFLQALLFYDACMDTVPLIFVIGSPRSGSTLLQRMLASHTQIYSHPEPHLITPLYYLGYYDTVEKAPYDAVNAATALREFAQELPRGEEDYLDALRAYANVLYGCVLTPTGKKFFLDKTPAYALVLPFLCKLYPQAKFIVLTRHPLAIMHSVAHSFFGGDYVAADAAGSVVARYVPAIGQFLVDAPVPFAHVRYEDLVTHPEQEMRRLLSFLRLEFEPQVVDYGRQKHLSKSYGDPVAVDKHLRPVTDSLTTWAQDLAAQPAVMQRAAACMAALSPAHLQAWGYPSQTLFDPCRQVDAAKTRRQRWDHYQVQRRVLLAARKGVRHPAVRQAVRKVRYVCDVLLKP